jgi:hypothetical protein
MPNIAKLLTETLQLADGGKVECDVVTPDGTVTRSVIEQSFFDEFVGAPNQHLSPKQQTRIVNDNVEYLEAEVERQWRMGNRELVIR